ADPALAAGADFVRLLARHGVAVRGGVARATALAGATELARVQSPTVAGLVEQMLATSDNDLAEVLFRQVAVARGRPGTFVDGRAEVAAILGELGVPTDGMRLLDGSGLARGSRVSPETVARLLAAATGDRRPALRPLVTGLPVAAFSGTLDDRLDEAGAGRAGAGLVRAKTGTLTGVDSLAGLATGAGGRLLVFAVMADRGRPADVLRAQDGLDRFAAAVAVIAGDMGG
ncbi:MAG: D-alanyl-D-alanine carboxypeptidase/D-alanyl-D-alanine endopeptidase, partial [Actinomycetes bacterium]